MRTISGLDPASPILVMGVQVLAGIDTHKDTLAVAVIDDAWRPVVICEIANTEAGFTEVEELFAAHQVSRVGIEGSGNYGRGLALRLVVAGQVEVVEVPPSLTSRERTARPGAGKTDPVDAVAIARITAREPMLPPVRLASGQAAELRALVDYRAQLVEESTALANRVHSELHGLLPGYHAQVPKLTSRVHLTAAQRLLEGDDRVRADLTRRRLIRMLEIDTEVRALTKQLRQQLTAIGTGLTEIYGVGPVIAATVIGEVVDVRRYRSRHAFAAANGTAPIPASSGRTSRHRLNRSGNRRLNRALYTVAITQIRAETEGSASCRRKVSEGKTEREALRCLKRRLSDIVYRTLFADIADPAQPAAGPTTQPAPAVTEFAAAS